MGEIVWAMGVVILQLDGNPRAMAAASGMSGHCFEGPVVCVVRNIWGQGYVC